MSPLTDPLGPDLKATLRSLKLGKLTATLPERLTLARQSNMPHADFLQLILSDEVTRREAGSITLRARNAGLDPSMRTETWDPSAAIRYDQQLWNELVSLRFLDAPYGALILGPVGVGKTHLATALGHIAIRRRRTVHMARADKLFKRLTAARLDNTLDYECARSLKMRMWASLAVRMCGREIAPPAGCWRGCGVRGGVVVVSLP
jgi:DNA replication protein DnaC